MENELEQSTQTPVEENTLVYIVGAVIVVAVIVFGVILWPKTKTTTDVKEVSSPTSTTSGITKLACESEWYNPVIGMSKYYLSARGSDTKHGTIECTFTLTNASGAAILNEKVTATTTAAPDRNGETFTCTTKALEKIPQNVPVVMTSIVKNDEGKTASCTGTVTFQ